MRFDTITNKTIQSDQDVFYRNQFIKLINTTDQIKQQITQYPTCSYLNDW